MKTIKRSFVLSVACFFLSSLIGCGNVGMSGKVTFSDDGTPLPTGTIVFEKGSRISRGDLKPDGTFTVGSLKEADGLPPGEYKIYFDRAVKVVVAGRSDSGIAEVTEPLIDPKYSSPETSGLTLNISRSIKNFDLKVDRYVPPKK